MALFGKDRDRTDRPRVAGYENVVSEPSVTTPDAHPSDRGWAAGEPLASAAKAYLGKGSRVAGKLFFEGPAQIDGQVDGEIQAQDTLTIGEGAVVNAQIVGASIIVHGRVTGDVTARKRLEIRAPGALIGNIVTPSLVIHEGVVFEGQCTMGTGGVRTDRSKVPAPSADASARKSAELAK
jgi:cytoskeletal protein CcmA (bactofilin family)